MKRKIFNPANLPEIKDFALRNGWQICQTPELAIYEVLRLEKFTTEERQVAIFYKNSKGIGTVSPSGFAATILKEYGTYS